MLQLPDAVSAAVRCSVSGRLTGLLCRRGEDDDLTPTVSPKAPGNATVFFSCKIVIPSRFAVRLANPKSITISALNGDCIRQQTQWSDGLEFVSGSFVWTLRE